MTSPDDRRLIEDYLPIKEISAEAAREKSVRKGDISTLHLWWARRSPVACWAAVYGALVPASRFGRESGGNFQGGQAPFAGGPEKGTGPYGRGRRTKAANSGAVWRKRWAMWGTSPTGWATSVSFIETETGRPS